MLIRGLTEPVGGDRALGLSPGYVLSVRVPAREHGTWGTGRGDVGNAPQVGAASQTRISQYPSYL